MSHEIRTPVNGVLGMLELVKQTKLDARQQRYLDTARRSAETLLGIINGILDISKIEAGKIELEQAPFDLRDLVEEVTETFADVAYGKGLELTCTIPASLPTALIGDAGRLRQILTNLIGNAIKFTEKGEVGIRVEAVEADAGSAFVAFDVTDTGIGIPADKQRHIFDAFAQADSSTTRRYGGTGLGLSIAKQLCEMMGGTIDLTSEPTRGSTFRFTARFGRQNEAAKSADAELATFQGMAVLVIEDNAVRRRNLKDQLLSWGVRVGEAENGAAALAELRASAARNERFDMAIIDIDLPDVSGIDLVRRIKADPANTELRIVMLTLRDHEIDEFGEMRAYVAASLSKPVRQATLRHCLAALESGAEPMLPPSELPPAPPPEGVAGARVLLVEDNPVNLEVAVGILESFGCKVETATNGVEALERYASSEYGLIFMDCQMPEMDGFEATAEIRKHEVNSDRRTPDRSIDRERDRRRPRAMPGLGHGRLRAEALHHRADALGVGDLAQPGDARHRQARSSHSGRLGAPCGATASSATARSAGGDADRADRQCRARQSRAAAAGGPPRHRQSGHHAVPGKRAGAAEGSAGRRRQGRYGAAASRQPHAEIGQRQCRSGAAIGALPRARSDGAHRRGA